MLPSPPRRALLVGINNYKTGDLEYCVSDAQRVGEQLNSPTFDFKVDCYLDLEITRDSLQDRLEKFFSQDASAYLFYYSGHGYKARFACNFVTTELESEDFGNGLPMDYLNNLMMYSANPDAPMLVILDCCHAGAFKMEQGISKPYVTTTDIRNSIVTTSGRVLLAACLENQSSIVSSEIKSSVFTHYLLEGLSGQAANRNGDITVSALNAYVAAAMSRIDGQIPLFAGHFPGDMILGKLPSTALEGPREKDIRDDIQELERESTEFRQKIGNIMRDHDENPTRWRLEGYQRASTELRPILDWFDRKASQRLNDRLKRALEQSSIFDGNKTYARLARERMAASLHVGMRVSRGVIKKEIGHGGFGTVWLVESEDGEKWAYKTCHSSVFQEADKVQWFRRGFKAMSQLDHPDIVRVRSEDWTEAAMGFYMQYIDGLNWRNYGPAHHVDFDDIIEQLLTLTKAIMYAHERNDPVYHRDIKPENILVGFDATGKANIVLTDFDLAWFNAASTIYSDRSKAMMMFLLYAAPEFINNPYSPETEKPTTDIYSFGQLIYFALTNDDPNPVTDNSPKLQHQIGRHKPSVDASEKLVELYRDCTRPSIGARPQSMSIVYERLLEIQLASQTGLTDVTPRKFLRQLILILQVDEMGFVDIDNFEANFPTPSGIFRIFVTVEPDRHQRTAIIRLHCVAEQNIMVGGATTFNEARRTIYSRLETNLKRHFPDSRLQMEPTNDRNFGAFINLLKVELSQQGIHETSLLIQEVKKQLDHQ